MKKIAVFIPVYNEAEALQQTLRQIPKTILHRKTELFIVDDCSTDNSAEIARSFTPNVTVLEKNSGVGTVTKTGLNIIAAREDIDFVIKLDGDGQHHTDRIPLMATMLEAGNDLVICSRFHPHSDQSHTPKDRILLNMIFTEMVRKITGWRLTDVRSGYMGFQHRHIRNIASSLVVPGYGVPMELILRIWGLNEYARVHEIPHPAVYGGRISRKLQIKYLSEDQIDKGDRVKTGYAALLAVIEDMKIPKEKILEMNGFARIMDTKAS